MEPTGTNSASFQDWEAKGIARDVFIDQFMDAFGDELKAIAAWIEAAPQGGNLEGALEVFIDQMRFDCSDDGDGEDWDLVIETIYSHSPRLQAERSKREAQA